MYVSACIKFAVVSLAKASHMAKSMVKVGKQHWGHEYNESILDKAAVQGCFSGWLHVLERGAGKRQ